MSGINLLITGLCSFVPNPSLEDSKDDYKLKEMTVLFAESYNPAPGHLGHVHGQHELHVPVLVCPEKYVVYDEGFRHPDMTFQPTPYPDNQDYEDLMAVFFLDDQDITIQAEGRNDLTVDLTEVEDCPGNDSSFHWVVPLKEVNPGTETARDSCFDPLCDPSVISRLHLLQGHITTAKLATNLDREILRWYFQEDGRTGSKELGESEPKKGQAIAAVVGVLFDLDGGQGIEFTTSLLHKDSSNRRVEAIFSRVSGNPLRIRLVPTDDHRKVWIKNMPWLDILQVRKLREPTCDAHFAHIYKLSKNPVSVVKVPCPTGETCKEFDRRHGAGTDCPYARMQANYPK